MASCLASMSACWARRSTSLRLTVFSAISFCARASLSRMNTNSASLAVRTSCSDWSCEMYGLNGSSAGLIAALMVSHGMASGRALSPISLVSMIDG
ncbi:hypothetical protein D3C72_1313510 [compost metagenome]